MEIELRARLRNGPVFLRSLRRRKNITFLAVSHEDDRYFRQRNDRARKLVLRIRRRDNSAWLTFKARSKRRDTAWLDVDLPLGQPDELERLITGNGYVPVVRIQKRRWTFRYQGLEVNVDRVRELGWFVEVEARGTARQRRGKERLIERTLDDFGVTAHAVLQKGYVPLVIDRKRTKLLRMKAK